jgi:hypothetical protein
MNDTDGTQLSIHHPLLPRLEPSVFDLDAYFPGMLFWKWAWVDRYDLTERQYEELEAKGWQSIQLTIFPSVFLPLTSQLFEIRGVFRREKPQTGDPLQDFTLWARRRDGQHAQAYPMVLVTEMGQHRATESELAKLVPGSQAILFTGSNTVYRYTLRDLGEQGAALWEHIKDGLRKEELTFSNHQNGVLLPCAERQRRAEEFTRFIQSVLERYERGCLAAAELAQRYWERHRTAPNKPVRLPQTLADIPLGFRQVKGEGYPILATLGLEVVLLALSNAVSGAKDRREKAQQPMYHLIRETGVASVTIPKEAVKVDIQKADTQGDITRKLWERVRAIDDLDGIVLLAMLIHAVLVGPDERGGIWITAVDILGYRGIVQKRHG